MAVVSNLSTNTANHARKRRNRMIVAAFFLFIALVVTLESPITRVRKVVVSGNGNIPAASIVQSAQLKAGMSLWQVNPNWVNHLVRESQPLVQSVRVSTNYIHGLVHLTIQQKHVVALLDVSGKFYPLLNDGVVYGAASVGSGFAWPIVTSPLVQSVVNGRTTADPNIPVLCRQISMMSPSTLAQLSEFQLDANGVVTVYLNNSFEIRSKVQSVGSDVGTGLGAVQYFEAHHYGPGVIDLTGQPPYQYTPFH